MSKEKTDYASQNSLLFTTFETLCDIDTICCDECPCKDYCDAIANARNSMPDGNFVENNGNVACGKRLRNYLNTLDMNEEQQSVFLIKYLNRWYFD